MQAWGLKGETQFIVYILSVAVGGADSRPFRTRKYPRGLEKGAKRERQRERDLHGVCCVEGGGEDDPTGPLLREE